MMRAAPVAKLRAPGEAGETTLSIRGSVFLRRALLAVLVLLMLLTGCTRRFFRNRADREAESLLNEKNRPEWEIENFHVYPDPRARFSDTGNPDRPPMPPDDPGAAELSPNPQRPGKAGVALMEGGGYLDQLAEWDAENRAPPPTTTEQAPPPRPAQEEPPGNGDKKKQPGQTYGGITGINVRDPLASEQVAKPYRIKLDQSIELALFNSREFQDRREDLYLSALPVTVERFAFSTQFFAFGQVIRERLGKLFPGGPSNRWAANTNVGFTKLFSTGALMLFQFANRTVVELASSRSPRTISESTLTFDAIQPLLRGGGQAVTLEPLTLSERNLLYEVRDYARFRKQFYVAIAGGSDVGAQTVGATRFRNRPATFLSQFFIPGADVRPGNGGAFSLAATGNATVSGYLPTLLNIALLENERTNVAKLEQILELFGGFRDRGDISPLQVYRVEQQLLQSRITTYQRDQQLRDSLDRFKIQLGVPTDLSLELDDTEVRPLREQMRRFERVFADFDRLRKEAANPKTVSRSVTELRNALRQRILNAPLVQGTTFRATFPARWAEWENIRSSDELRRRLRDVGTQRDAAKEQKENLTDVREMNWALPAWFLNEVDTRLQRDVDELTYRYDVGAFELALRNYESRPSLLMLGAGLLPIGPLPSAMALNPVGPEESPPDMDELFREVADSLEVVLLIARNQRLEAVRRVWPQVPRICLQGDDLMTAELERAETAVAQVALENRLDLMNARAQLVDAWRQIAVAANSLLGTFNVEYHLNSLTPPGLAEPFGFDGSRTRHQLRLNYDLPLVRIQERNAYRASLIAWQRQRRTLMASEDSVVRDVRSELRQLRVLAENYRIQQRAVEVAYLTVESSLEAFLAPPVPTNLLAGGGGATDQNAALTQQLLQAQNDLLRAQNGLMQAYVQYVTTRLQLYRDLELMPLDPRGVWTNDIERCHCPGEPASQPSSDDGRTGGGGKSGSASGAAAGQSADAAAPSTLVPPYEGYHPRVPGVSDPGRGVGNRRAGSGISRSAH